MVREIPTVGTPCTALWYGSYHSLVQLVPRFGTSPATGWYAPYQRGYSFRFPLYFLFFPQSYCYYSLSLCKDRMRLGKPGDAVSTSGSVMRQIINEQLQISESNPIKARYYDYDRFTYPWHFHSQYEIIYVKKSCGRCFVGDCIERFSEGDVVLFGPSLPHYMRSDDAYHGDNPRLRVQGTIIQFEENFMQYSFDHYPQFHQIRVLLKEARRGVVFHTADAGPVRDMVSAFPELKGFGQITGLLDLLQALAVSVPRRMLASQALATMRSFPQRETSVSIKSSPLSTATTPVPSSSTR